jgi:hypothetical protein
VAARFTRLLASLPLLAALPAAALTFSIGNGSAQIYLRVGDTGGTVSTVSFNLTGSESILGNGTPIYGTVAASAGAASAETGNFPACPANHVRIVARVRAPGGNPRTGTLQVTSSTALTHAASGNTIPFTEFGWDSDDAAEFASGTFTGATQVLDPVIPSSQETGACHRFKFLNTQVYPGSVGGAGSYQGSVTYNLNAP